MVIESPRRPRSFLRAGFSLVEVIFAFAMLSGLLGVLMHFFMGSQRQAVGSEQKLNSALLAQMVIERMRSQVAVNPAYFKQLGMTSGTWVSSGTAVDPAAATPSAGTQLSPFFEHLFLREGTDLYTAANRVAIPAVGAAPVDAVADPVGARRRGLVEAFRDYRVDVKVEDDQQLETGAAAALRELVKKVTVTISRGSVIAKLGSDPGAVVLATRMVTPPESLSTTAMTALNANFTNATELASAQEEFFVNAGDATYLSENYLGARRTMIADCYMILGTVNTETYLTKGDSVSDVFLNDTTPAKSLNVWLAELSQDTYYQHGVFKKQVARLQRMKAKATFDAFKRLLPLLEDLDQQHQKMLPEIEEMTAILNETHTKILDLDKDTADAMKAYQDNAKHKKDAENALTALEPASEEASKLATDAVKFKGEYEAAKLRLEEMVAASAPASDIATTTAFRDSKKVKWENKKQQADDKLEEVTEKRAELTGKLTEATTTMTNSLTAINTKMAAFAALTTASGKDLMDRLQLVVVCKFLNDFFHHPKYPAFVNRIREYPAQFRDSLTASRKALLDFMNQAGGATPLEFTVALQDLVEVEKTRMLEKGSLDESVLAELSALSEKHASRLHDVASYLKSSEIHDWNTLSARNDPFLKRLQVMKNMGDASNPANTYENIVSLYAPGGKIKVFLDTYTKVASDIALNSDLNLVKLNKDIQGLRGDLNLIGSATAEEILRAMRNP